MEAEGKTAITSLSRFEVNLSYCRTSIDECAFLFIACFGKEVVEIRGRLRAAGLLPGKELSCAKDLFYLLIKVRDLLL